MDTRFTDEQKKQAQEFNIAYEERSESLWDDMVDEFAAEHGMDIDDVEALMTGKWF